MKYNMFFLGAVCSLVFVSCSSEKQEEKKVKFTFTDDQLKGIEYSASEIRPVMGELSLNGKVVPDENNLVNVYPMIGGKVIDVNFEIGDLVDLDKPLITLNSGEAREFEKEYLAAQDEYELAKKGYEIQMELNKSKFSSARELAYAKKDLEIAKAELARLKEVYKVYSITEGGKYVIKSPVAGFILEKKVGPNMQIRSDANDYLFSVARLDEVFIAFDIYEKDIAKVKKGQSIQIQLLSNPDSTIVGTVKRIENIIDPETRTVKARVYLKNPGYNLKPHMFCTGKLLYSTKSEMVSVNKKALIFDKNKYFLMIYHSKTNIETRQVEVYSSTDEFAYISSGLSPGEKVITKKQMYIYDALND
jgi:cobalt-zinc-cadmium efflux system membrane fusion protein